MITIFAVEAGVVLNPSLTVAVNAHPDVVPPSELYVKDETFPGAVKLGHDSLDATAQE